MTAIDTSYRKTLATSYMKIVQSHLHRVTVPHLFTSVYVDCNAV